ncbi:fibroblast growth factor 21-like [Pleuronectes platessa]|uniref:fibroblast growth factor 21-like n=1 Tax=Pleuronectes platessa TaxID=8262 RepID=UPI00232A3CD0|nr:fibroblast growth factor 21-like [Pleuronectes platessa]
MVSFSPTTFSYLCSFLSIILLPSSRAFYLPDSNPLLSFNNQVREVHLYTDNHRRGMYLQMTQDGRVSGSEVQTPYSVLQLKSVRPGHIVINGLSSSLFLCMDSDGHLRGQMHHTDADCTFQELVLGDGYTRFLSSYHGFPMSLASKRSPDRHAIPFTQFLPLANTLTRERMIERPPKRSSPLVNSSSVF